MLISLIFGYYIFTIGFTSLPLNLSKILLPIVLTIPILFSGIAFSKELLKLKSVSQALSSNILGAMVGGFLEYNSMYYGFSSLYILAGILYLLAFVFSVNKLSYV